MTDAEIHDAWARTWPNADPALSQAVVAYIGPGPAPSPSSTRGEARIAELGFEPARDLARRVEDLLHGCDRLTIPPNDPTTQSMANELRSYIALVHGELNPAAADAICRRFNWTWR